MALWGIRIAKEETRIPAGLALLIMEKIMRLFCTLLFVSLASFLWPTPVAAQSGIDDIQYVSPRPDAILVNAGTTIAVRPGVEINPNSLSDDLFTVIGDMSGTHSGKVLLADDKLTVIFTPDQPFTSEEVVSVTFNNGLEANTGLVLDNGFSYTFTVSPLTSVQASAFHQKRVQKSLLRYDAQYGSLDEHLNEPFDLQSPVDLLHMAPLTGTQSYATIPDTFPHISVTVPANDAGEGYIFTVNLTRRSPFPYLLIFENNGDPVYHRSMDEGVRFRDFRVQPNGQLTYFYQPDFVFHAMDNTYKIVESYQAGNGYLTDFHGLQVNEEGYALLQIYDDQPIDMSTIVAGGLVTATVTGAIVQEVDPSGNVVFEWRSWDHFDILDASDQVDFTSDDVDVTHINSAEWDTDGNIIMSNRNIDEITKISRATADVLWRFGGKKNQFALTNTDEEGVEFFNWQHDARRQPTGTITLYDNGNHKEPPRSRAVEYELDEENLTATQVWQYRNVPDFFGFATGNVQRLPNGNSVINWGGVGVNEHLPFITEVQPDGSKAYEAYFVENQSSYRTFRFPWEGKPFEPPLLIGSVDAADIKLHYSWNGATQISSYDIYGGPTTNPADFAKLTNQAKQGFETTSQFTKTDDACYFYYVMPIDQNGQMGIASNMTFVGDQSCPHVATITADSPATATLSAPESGGSVAITSPTGAVSETVTLVLDDTPVPTQPLPEDRKLVMAFALNAQIDATLQPNFRFNDPISLTAKYPNSAVAGLDTSTLEVRYWNARRQHWDTDGIVITDSDSIESQIAFTTEHLTLFAIFAQEQTTELLTDTSFEIPPSDSPWVFSTASQGEDTSPLSCATHSCGYDAVRAHTGERLVFLGFFADSEQVSITQSVESPSEKVTRASLSLWLMRRGLEGSLPFTGKNTLKLFIDETELLSVTDLDLQEGRYIELSADVTEQLNRDGLDTHSIRIEGAFEPDGGAIYIDDVSLKVSVEQNQSTTIYMPFFEVQ